MNKLFEIDSQIVNSLIPQTTDLFMSGLHWLKVIAESDKEIRFPKWVNLLKNARRQSDNLSVVKLQWLWDSITKEPGIKNYLMDSGTLFNNSIIYSDLKIY